MFRQNSPLSISQRHVRQSTKTLLACFFLLLFSANAIAEAKQAEILLDKNTKSHILGSHMEFLEDPSKKLTIQDVTSTTIASRFAPHNKDFPSFGFTESAYWYRTEIINPDPVSKKLILEEVIPYIDSIKLFLPDPANPGDFIITEVGDK